LVDLNNSAYVSPQKLMKYRQYYDKFARKIRTKSRLCDSIELANLCADLNDERGLDQPTKCMPIETSE
jgi:hypothetical protein